MIFFALLAFLLCGEYAITRPVSNALFLTEFSASIYPWVWLATVPLNLTTIYLYNRYLSVLGPKKIFSLLACFVIVINLCTSFYPIAPLIFLQYAWKDIYILLMLKQLWSAIHTRLSDSSGRYYSLIYGAGTSGAILGSLIPANFAGALHAESILLFTLPIYLLAASLFYKVAPQTIALQEEPRPMQAWTMIRTIPTLTLLLLFVVFMQVSVGLMEYRFNTGLEAFAPDKNLRAAHMGTLMSYTNSFCLCLQLIGGFFLYNRLGARKTHIAVPCLLAIGWGASILFPTFSVLSATYVLFKTIDFGVFNIAREMLYSELSVDAKYRAKSVIDVFAYRTSKALVSFGLIALQAVAGIYLLTVTSVAAMAIFGIWATLALLFAFKQLQPAR